MDFKLKALIAFIVIEIFNQLAWNLVNIIYINEKKN